MAETSMINEHSLNEECGIFGIWNHEQAANLTFYGLHALQHRGQEGAGIVARHDDGQLWQERGLGLLSDVFADPRRFDNLTGSAAIGHVRYATAGNHGVENIQPFMVNFADMQVALAHNGNITNAKTLRAELEQEGAIFQSSSDTEILLHLIRRSSADGFEAQLVDALNQVHGGFAFLLLTPDAMYAALDPHGFRPFVIGQFGDEARYVVASETAALNAVGANFLRDVQPGELIRFDRNGMHIDHYTQATRLNIDVMEYIYFARPDSNIYGINVHQARQRMGAKLAQEAPIDADMVVGVPNSSLSAAMGYADAANLPNEMGLIKNQYIARSFIEPTQSRRERAVGMKLTAMPAVVSGKRIVLIDDSIVRGTTSKYIIQMLREAGAKSVHVRIASPAFKYPSFFGVDMQTTDELMAANYSQSEMQTIIGADSLEFLSVPGLVESIGLPKQSDGNGLTTAYFDGHYPAPVYDYQADLAPLVQTGQVTFDDEPTQDERS
ncbi:amidophosphoribosyltransferase [Weissella uvarum]|uniref:amidophosphoribosyltransferase n=1 Tax=Weissella uvarum TaxID=1479233 RepID=UPI0019604BA8|nr:amidophosphoribosyltransferase [Weissella uvarum]MBM7617494.1 amidophosphoribosyltransferase [Weissella uvarum]MCM0595622.1 amidophosphoribosyltransferase [Weissella uvarum]